jgi:hypothetical protein
MKIYFDGCSWTRGAELKNKKETRFSKIISEHYGAEEYNIGEFGGCNRRLARNIINHNLDDYDMFIIQMTIESRTEWYDGNNFTNVRPTTPSTDDEVFWQTYYENYYHQKYGESDELIYYNLFKNILRDKKHIIVSISSSTKLPVKNLQKDLWYYNSRSKLLNKKILFAPFHHPNELGHKIIAEMLINYLDKT